MKDQAENDSVEMKEVGEADKPQQILAQEGEGLSSNLETPKKERSFLAKTGSMVGGFIAGALFPAWMWFADGFFFFGGPSANLSKEGGRGMALGILCSCTVIGLLLGGPVGAVIGAAVGAVLGGIVVVSTHGPIKEHSDISKTSNIPTRIKQPNLEQNRALKHDAVSSKFEDKGGVVDHQKQQLPKVKYGGSNERTTAR